MKNGNGKVVGDTRGFRIYNKEMVDGNLNSKEEVSKDLRFESKSMGGWVTRG